MADKKVKKVIKKTVNLSGKKIEKASLALKEKKNRKIESKKDIAKVNEKLAKKETKKAEVKTEEKKVVKKKVAKSAKYELSVDMRDLLKAGCHLGHKKSKTHPKAKENIYVVKNGVSIFDLPTSIKFLDKACQFVFEACKSGKKIVMVGTKRQAREAVKRVADEMGLAYVTDRWLGGTISNWNQIKLNIDKLNELKDGIEKGEFVQNTKREQSLIKKEISRLERIVGGLVKLEKLFDVLFVVDANFEKTAVREARGKGIPVVAMVDSDTDPGVVDYPIPLNDDSVKSVSLIVEEIGKATK